MKRLAIVSMLVVMLIGVVAGLAMWRSATPPPGPRTPPPPAVSKKATPSDPLRNAYFGELHLHTTYSLDAKLFGTQADPRMAYRFAAGEALWLPESQQYQRLTVPLDFAAVTDHAEGLGLYQQCHDAGSDNYYSFDCIGMRMRLLLMFPRFVGSAKQEGRQTGHYLSSVCGKSGETCRESAKSLWQDIQDAANEYYQPGKFTTFIGFEYSPTLRSAGMAHRNIIFGSSSVPDNVFSSYDGFVEDLLRWLDTSCQGDCQALSIPHNPNWSWGLMFGETNSDGTPLTRDNLALRAKLEKHVEIFQIKGNSECAAGVGNNDEQCGFENLWPACSDAQQQVDPVIGQHAPRCIGPNDTVRQVLKNGLRDEQKWGFNPYKLGLVGATDSHNATPGDTQEGTWSGHGGRPDSTADFRLGYKSNMVSDTLGFPLAKLNPGGLTGVWAEENTREAIFAAMQRRETFATSGSRIRVRLFAGFDYPSDLHLQPDMLTTAYARGVPMGADLSGRDEQGAPSFMVQAIQDVNSARLQKIQIIKGWLAAGESHEQVYDVVCSDGLQPDAATHRCADNGARVKLEDCSVSADRGATELATTWTDPDFTPAQSAFYYARVLENPTCRWSQYDALRSGQPHPEGIPATVQERAWTSPVWYSPTR